MDTWGATDAEDYGIWLSFLSVLRMGKRMLNGTFGNLGSNSRSSGLQALFRTCKEGAPVTSALLKIIGMHTYGTLKPHSLIIKPPPTARQLLECQYWRL